MSLLDKLVIVLFPRADSSTFRIQVGGLVLLTGFQGRRRRGGGGVPGIHPPGRETWGYIPCTFGRDTVMVALGIAQQSVFTIIYSGLGDNRTTNISIW